MDNGHRKWLTLSIAVLVFSSYMGLATTFRYAQMSVTVPLLLIVMMPIGEWADRNFALYRKVTSAITVLFVILMPFIGSRIGLMDSVIALFIYIQVYSLVHQKSTMEYYHIILMSLFLLIAALVMSPSASMGFVLFFFILSGAASLLLTDWHRQVSNARSVAPDRRSVGTRMGALGKPARSLRIVPLTAMLGALVILLTSVVFVFMPRTSAGVLGRTVRNEVYTTGLSEEVSLNINDTIVTNSSPVMRVQFLSLENGEYPGELYWRSTTMDKYTGTGWVRQGMETRPRSIRRESGKIATFRTVPVDTRDFTGIVRYPGEGEWPTVDYEIFVDSYPEGGFPLLSVVDRIAPKESTKSLLLYWENGGDFTVSLNYRGELQPYFVGHSRIVEPTPEMLRAASEDYLNTMVANDLQLLTEYTLQSRTIDLAESLTRDAETNYDKVLAIERHFRTAEFTYTRNVPALDPEYPLDSFIHDMQLGHCELYASAMALMVRSQGIPARVVSGYRGGDWDPADKSYTVTNSMAHLWVEVFFPNVGWVTFDPTPSGEEIQLTFRQEIMNTIARYSLKLRVLWLQYVVGYRPGDTFTLFRDRAFALFSEMFRPDVSGNETITKINWPSGLRGVLLALSLLGFVTLMLAALVMLFRRVKRARGRALTVDQEKVRELYLGLRTKLIRGGMVEPNATAEELSESLNGLPEESRHLLQRFITRYHDVRFGMKPLSTGEHDDFRAAVRALEFPPRTA